MSVTSLRSWRGLMKGQALARTLWEQTWGMLPKQPYICPIFIFLRFLRETTLKLEAKSQGSRRDESRHQEKANKKASKWT